jgi:FAD/FMN-containing dehydrogenase
MVTPNAEWLDVMRVDHNLGKIHDAGHACFELKWSDAQGNVTRTETLTIAGNVFRKAGLGKDVTDKFLAGLPGVQKEGCDGIITSARFILHRMPAHTRTVCLEFFGLAKDAVPAIVEIKDYVQKNDKGVLLAGLEHLDALGTLGQRPAHGLLLAAAHVEALPGLRHSLLVDGERGRAAGTGQDARKRGQPKGAQDLRRRGPDERDVVGSELHGARIGPRRPPGIVERPQTVP